MITKRIIEKGTFTAYLVFLHVSWYSNASNKAISSSKYHMLIAWVKCLNGLLHLVTRHNLSVRHADDFYGADASSTNSDQVSDCITSEHLQAVQELSVYASGAVERDERLNEGACPDVPDLEAVTDSPRSSYYCVSLKNGRVGW